MYIKRLEIKGFKSFPDKTVLEFKTGVTSVVGPNGCGKSNIIEAIKWVMGEQRVKSLRSKKMEEVIFTGSDNRKQISMAEVKLVLGINGDPVPSGLADYDEIMISRRLFRDGESNYEINGVRCRLSDIHDFFLDTGVGKNSYAIIEQGRVDTVVASRPEDRRSLIEEAAGISRYKSRKEAALKKLELTEHNLIRINDLVSEVKRQSNAVKKQAMKAERYRKLSEEIRMCELTLSAGKAEALSASIEVLTGNLTVRQKELIETESRSATISALLEQDRLKLLEIEKIKKNLLHDQREIDQNLARIRSLDERTHSRMAVLKDSLEKKEVDRKHAKSSLERNSDRLLELQENITREELQLADLTAAIRESELKFRGADEELNSIRRRSEELKDEIFRNLQEAATQRNKRQNLVNRSLELDSKSRKSAVDLEKLTRELADLEIEKSENRSNYLCSELHLTELKLAHEKLLERLDCIQRDRAKLNETLSQLDVILAGKSARLESLVEIQKNYSMYGSGTEFLLTLSEFEELLWGPITNLIEVDPEYRPAITSVMGSKLKDLVSPSLEISISAAATLMKEGLSRTSLILLHPISTEDRNCHLESGVVEARDVVSCSPEFEELINVLLKNVYIVNDPEVALNLHNSAACHVDVVTKEGIVITKEGRITAGNPDPFISEVFEKRDEIRILETEISTLVSQRNDSTEQLKQTDSSFLELNDQISASTRIVEDEGRKLSNLKRDSEQIEVDIKDCRKKIEVIGLETNQFLQEKEHLEDNIAVVDDVIESLSDQKTVLDKARSEALEKMEALLKATQENTQLVQELRIESARMSEQLKFHKQNFIDLQNQTKRLETLLEDLHKTISTDLNEREELSILLKANIAEEQDTLEKSKVNSENISRFSNESEALFLQLSKNESEYKSTASRIKQIENEIHSIELEKTREQQQLSSIIEQMLEKYGVHPSQFTPSSRDFSEDYISDLKTKLQDFGEVNLAAISEHKAIEDRLTFLLEQQKDLQNAVDSLYSTISHINKTTRDRFLETFGLVDRKFQEIFPFLFRGGDARLELTDENDVLAAGIEIYARPAGKRVRNMDLLSGGEKALTAVALIFSIFLIKPSPFCLLDEVDAPLDETNLIRFNEMLRMLSKQTQFLVITHNKRSMEEADCLYGVTMPDPGVSRVVSVEFKN